MRFSSYTIVVTYFMAALGLAAVSLVESIEPWFTALMAGVALASLVFNIKGKAVIRRGIWNFLAVVVLLLFIADYTAVSRSLVTSAGRFLTVLLTLKLFDTRAGRDYMIICSIVFFQILAAASSTVSPAFLIILALFVLGAIFAMIILSLKKEMSERAEPEERMPAGFFGVPFFFTITGVTVISLAISLAIFFILPRMGMGFFQNKTLNTVKVTGFAERVDLGSIGPVKTDATVVMRVEITGRRNAPGTLYWRGTALDYYDGRSWSRSIMESRVIKREPDAFPVGAVKGELLEQDILLEPLETEVIFAASHPSVISGGFTSLRVDYSGSVYLPSPPYSRVEYKAWSSVSPVMPGTGEAPEYREKYTDVSSVANGQAGERLRGLSAQITKGRASDLDKARSIEEYLKANYGYTLLPRKGKGLNPLDDFLFFSKEGYCEHYATAMVLLLRASGIPARIVTGFLQGEWNSLGNYFIVRQQDAHSWVEAYIDNTGWVTFDPTPLSGTQPVYAQSKLSLYLDFLRLKWNRYIINYTFADQRRMASAMEARTTRLAGTIKRGFNFTVKGRSLYVIFSAVVFLYAAWALKSAISARFKRGSVKTPPYYLKMLRIMETKGFLRKIDETPLEFAQRVDNTFVTRITEAFQAQRYGGAALTGKDAAMIDEALQGLKRPDY